MTPLEKYYLQTRQGKGDQLAMDMFYAIFDKLCPNNDRAQEEVFDMPDLLVARQAIVGLTTLLLTYSLDDEDMTELYESFVRDLRSMFLADGPDDGGFVFS